MRLKPFYFFMTLAVLFLQFSSSAAVAWGAKGHQMVGDIAQEELSPSALKSLKSLMGSQVNLGKESNWPDEIRPNKAYARFRPWHYVDFPRISDVRSILMSSLSPKERAIMWSGPEDTSINFLDSLRQFSDYLLIPHAAEGDSIQAANQMAWLLTSPRATHEERIFALRYLAHIIGDIHQPLHNGNGNDKGGNSCQVIWKGQTQHTYGDGNTVAMNLHTVWDEELLKVRTCARDKECDSNDYIKFLKKEYPATMKNAKAEDYPGVFTAAEWSTEAAGLRDAVYPRSHSSYCQEDGGLVPMADRPPLGDEYFAQHSRTAETQVLKAGIRLGKVLNDILPHVAKAMAVVDPLSIAPKKPGPKTKRPGLNSND